MAFPDRDKLIDSASQYYMNSLIKGDLYLPQVGKTVGEFRKKGAGASQAAKREAIIASLLIWYNDSKNNPPFKDQGSGPLRTLAPNNFSDLHGLNEELLNILFNDIANKALERFAKQVEKRAFPEANVEAGSTKVLQRDRASEERAQQKQKEKNQQAINDAAPDVDPVARAESNRLNEQAALIISMEELLNRMPGKTSQTNNFIGVRDRRFRNFAPIRFTNNIADDKASTGHFLITNYLTKNESMNSFFSGLPPQAMSMLIPSIKLYKTIYEVVKDVKELNNAKSYDWRIPFDNVPIAYQGVTSEFVKPVEEVEKILSGKGNLRTVGIKSFNYEYRGTNPAEINTNIHASLTIFFQSPADLLIEIPISNKDPRFKKKPVGVNLDNVKFSYVDLINQQARTNIENGQQAINNRYYRIKVECGYADINKSVLNDVLQNAGKTKEQIEDIYRAIESTKVNLFLSPYRYDLSFQDDGSVELKIDYNASVDVMLASDSADIFKLTADSKALDEKIKIFEDFLNQKEITNNSPTEQEESTKCFDKQSYLDALEKLKKYGEENNRPELQNASTEDLLREMSELRKQAYNGLFVYLLGKAEIHKNIDSEVEDFVIKPQVYNALFTSDFIGARAEDDKDRVKSRAEALIKGGALIKKIGVIGVADEELIPPPEPNQDPKASQADAAAKTNAEKEKKKTDEDLKQGIYNVKYVLLGDVLDIALEVLNDITPKEDSPKVVIGTIPIVIPSFTGEDPERSIKTNAFLSGKEINPNLADIPISLNLFREFLIENIVKQQKTRYPVIQFIKDIISQLIYPAIQPKTFGNSSAINSSIRLSTAYLNFPAVQEDWDPLANKQADIRNYLSPVNDDVLEYLKLLKKSNAFFSFSGPERILSYAFLTCSSRFPKYLAGEFATPAAREENDKKNGVLNFRMGTDTGIIKKIAFERLNIPYQREMLMRQEGKSTTSLIKQFYNASVEMFGNNIFRPGDYVYIHPNYIYNNQVIDLTDKLGLGGYYLVLDVSTSISEGSYDTKLRCVFQASVFNNKVQDATSPCGDKPKQ